MSTTLNNMPPTIVKKKRLLLVDPDLKVDGVLKEVLTSDAWDIERTPDNDTALLLVKASPFDLVITGQHTSGREDVELLRKIRTIRPHVRMIILTANSTREDVIASLRVSYTRFSTFRRI